MIAGRALRKRSIFDVRLLTAVGSFGLAVATACSSSNSTPTAAPDAGGDAGAAGTDSGTPPSDAAAMTVSNADAASTPDSGSTPDAATKSDAASKSDAATKSDGGVKADSGASIDAASSFVLTSPAFAAGEAIPAQNTCAAANTSPELDWTPGPSATLSYALVITDLDTGGVVNDAGVASSPIIHWVIWDIPTTVLTLPAVLPDTPTLTTPVMANQVDLRTAAGAATPMNGYFGPCPSGNTHHYQFALHAMDVATLPGVTTTTTSPNVKAAVLQHSIAEADLVGTSNASRPVATDAGDAATDQ